VRPNEVNEEEVGDFEEDHFAEGEGDLMEGEEKKRPEDVEDAVDREEGVDLAGVAANEDDGDDAEDEDEVPGDRENPVWRCDCRLDDFAVIPKHAVAAKERSDSSNGKNRKYR